MKILVDYAGRQVRLTDERLRHILAHSEMADMESQLEETVGQQMAVCGGKIWSGRCIRPSRVFDGQTEERNNPMVQHVKIWFDTEGDFLEVLFSDRPGFMRETSNDAVMERVDEEGNILGFSVMQVSRLAKDKPLVADLMEAVD